MVTPAMYFVVLSIAAAKEPPGKTITRTISRPEGKFQVIVTIFSTRSLYSRGAGRLVGQ